MSSWGEGWYKKTVTDILFADMDYMYKSKANTPYFDFGYGGYGTWVKINGHELDKWEGYFVLWVLPMFTALVLYHVAWPALCELFTPDVKPWKQVRRWSSLACVVQLPAIYVDVRSRMCSLFFSGQIRKLDAHEAAAQLQARQVQATLRQAALALTAKELPQKRDSERAAKGKKAA